MRDNPSQYTGTLKNSECTRCGSLLNHMTREEQDLHEKNCNAQTKLIEYYYCKKCGARFDNQQDRDWHQWNCNVLEQRKHIQHCVVQQGQSGKHYGCSRKVTNCRCDCHK